MIHPVKFTHQIMDLAGKLDWHTQRADIQAMKDTIKQLRSKINHVQEFIKTHEVIN